MDVSLFEKAQGPYIFLFISPILAASQWHHQEADVHGDGTSIVTVQICQRKVLFSSEGITPVIVLKVD